MRDLKFRVWSNDGNCWLGYDGANVLDLVYSAQYGAFFFDNDVCDIPKDSVWCQYTGLRDRSGKEIYEGDIISLPGHHNIFGIVEWGRDGWITRWDENTARVRRERWLDGLPANMSVTQEIIGNIYENGDLLKGSK
jgi:uncharacterized phage protein (TIGR01671 family)